MKITKLIIENFMAIGHAELSLTEKGLVLIQGENIDESSADSNGAGKSSIPDAMCWCLYDVTARGEKGDAIVNTIAKKNTLVQVHIEDGDDSYIITRYRKHHAGKGLHVADGDGNNLTLGTDRLTQDVVTGILGCSVEVFTSAVYAGQEKMPNLPGMTDKQLKLLVEEGAGIDRLQDAYTIARSRMNEKTVEYDKAVSNVETTMGRIEEEEENLDEIHDSIEEWSYNQGMKIHEETERAKDFINQAKLLNVEIEAHGEDAHLQMLTKLDSQIAGVASEGEKRALLERQVNEANSKLALALREQVAAEDVHRSLTRQLDNVESRVGTPCGECGKTYELKDISDARSNLSNQVLAAHDEIGVKAGAVNKREDEYQALQASLNEFVNNMTDISAAQALHAKTRETLKIIAEKKTRFIELKTNAVSATEKVKEMKTAENPHITMYDKCKLRIEELKEQQARQEVIAEQAEADLELLKDAVDVFSPAGVRAHILDTVTPYLNERTAHYLSTLSDGNITAEWSTLTTTAKGDLREKFNINVVNAKGAKSFAGLSGGEKRKVRLATAMALQDLVASRASKPIDLFIADEVDDALDSAGLERLMSILEEKARNHGTVLVISHNSLSDWIREQAIVRREGGLSTVTGVLSE